MKKLYMIIGFGLGALMVWSLTHKQRKHSAMWREEEEAIKELNKRMKLEDAIFEATYGPRRSSKEQVEAELARYDEDPFWWQKEEEDENE